MRLRGSEHVVAPPKEELCARGNWDYLVSLHRGGEEQHYEVWPFTVRDSLPRFRVPLTGIDPDVVLDLQAVVARTYEEGGYAKRLAYGRTPPKPLEEDDSD